MNDVEGVPGKKGAEENKDFVPIKMQTITFKSGEVEQRIEIEMPDCVGEATGDGETAEDIDTVSFALQLSSPNP